MATGATEQLCQRIGCNSKFTEDENADGSCRFHPGPLFHDGGKEWSCCKKKSHDFSMFLELPGCQTGKHTSVKPQPAASPVPKKTPIRLNTSGDAATCPRCKQGFYCSGHGAKLPTKISPPAPAPKTSSTVAPTAPKSTDLNVKQTCKNKGCSMEYMEKDNTATSCRYHPGPAVFRDRQRGWACCDIHVKDFDEFLEIAPCTSGWHNSSPDVVRTEAE